MGSIALCYALSQIKPNQAPSASSLPYLDELASLEAGFESQAQVVVELEGRVLLGQVGLDGRRGGAAAVLERQDCLLDEVEVGGF